MDHYLFTPAEILALAPLLWFFVVMAFCRNVFDIMGNLGIELIRARPTPEMLRPHVGEDPIAFEKHKKNFDEEHARLNRNLDSLALWMIFTSILGIHMPLSRFIEPHILVILMFCNLGCALMAMVRFVDILKIFSSFYRYHLSLLQSHCEQEGKTSRR
jgi:hypothetical protein